MSYLEYSKRENIPVLCILNSHESKLVTYFTTNATNVYGASLPIAFRVLTTRDGFASEEQISSVYYEMSPHKWFIVKFPNPFNPLGCGEEN